MKNLKTEGWMPVPACMMKRVQNGENEEKKWDEQANKDAMQRVKEFMQEDDETFFRRIIQGLSLSEIEAFLAECPEFRKYWNSKEN